MTIGQYGVSALSQRRPGRPAVGYILAVPLAEDPYFTIEDRQGVFYCTCRHDWDVPDVERLIAVIQPLIESQENPRFVMNLVEMHDITLTARWRTSGWMRGNQGRVARTAVIMRDNMQRFVLQTLLRVSGRRNVRACATVEEAFAFVHAPDPA